jgi:hypothetical protein
MCEKLERIEEIKEQILKLQTELKSLKDKIAIKNCGFSVGDLVKINGHVDSSDEKYLITQIHASKRSSNPVIYARKLLKSGKYGIEKDVWQLAVYGAEKCV